METSHCEILPIGESAAAPDEIAAVMAAVMLALEDQRQNLGRNVPMSRWKRAARLEGVGVAVSFRSLSHGWSV